MSTGQTFSLTSQTEREWINQLCIAFNIILQHDKWKQKKEYFQTCNTFEEVIYEMATIVDEWENYISESKKENYITDSVENSFKHAMTVFVHKVIEVNDIEYERVFERFNKCRHIGYGFFYAYEALKQSFYISKSEYDTMYKRFLDIMFGSLGKMMYMRLVDYFDKFFGRFYDNEDAIRMICSFYQNHYNLDENECQKTAVALYGHVSIAGEYGDVGYAYKGIQQIKDNIKYLPINIIEYMLNAYPIFNILNGKNSKKQILTIISYSEIQDKHVYKFYYLDSLVLADVVNKIIYQDFKEKFQFVEPYYLEHSTNNLPKLTLLTVGNDEALEGYWINDFYNKQRVFIYDNKLLAQILFSNGYSILYFQKELTGNTQLMFKCDLDDSYMTELSNKETVSKLALAYNCAKETSSSPFLFSHVVLNGFRGLENHQFSFDGKYRFDKIKNSIEMNVVQASSFVNFYSETIQTLSCIVGKNGTGKTSVMDFLRMDFFNLLFSEEMKVPFEYAVVFKLNNNEYCLTNIESLEIKSSNISLVDRNWRLLHQSNEIGKCVYFSNMITRSDQNIFPDEGYENSGKESENEKNIMRNLHIRMVDFSESRSFIAKLNRQQAYDNLQNEINNRKEDVSIAEQAVNRELYYQIAFLEDNKRKLSLFFEDGFDLEKLIIVQRGKPVDFKNLQEFLNSYKENNESLHHKISAILSNPLSEIRYLSSGQQAKLMFLSKLYWYLHGHVEHQELIKSYFPKVSFDPDETLKENDSVLIFIDEGELYYHPEWQRRFISTIVEFINRYAASKKAAIQLMITTNSPFMLSDVRQEDIFYLPLKEESCYNQTFGQNIHTLLTNNFYMKRTIGEIAHHRISRIIGWMQEFQKVNLQISYNNKSDFSTEEINLENIALKEKMLKEVSRDFGEVYNCEIAPNEIIFKLKEAIDHIGEDLYREKLLNMYYEHVYTKKEDEVERIKKMMQALEQRLRELS